MAAMESVAAMASVAAHLDDRAEGRVPRSCEGIDVVGKRSVLSKGRRRLL